MYFLIIFVKKAPVVPWTVQTLSHSYFLMSQYGHNQTFKSTPFPQPTFSILIYNIIIKKKTPNRAAISVELTKQKLDYFFEYLLD